MRRQKSRAPAETDEPKKTWLISDAKLLALHRRLLRAVAQGHSDAEHAEKGIERYAAARVALWFDLKSLDTVVEGTDGAKMRDALSTASRNKLRENRSVAVVWRGEAGADWQEALEEARAHSLPMVFVSRAGEGRNGRQILPHVNKTLKPGEELPCVTVDGHDVVAAYRVAHEAIERARRNRGPTLILLAIFNVDGRLYMDPVEDMERYLRGRGLLNLANGKRQATKRI